MEDRRFYIPNNYLDPGYVLNGLFSTRNFIEAIIYGILGFLICKSLPIPHGGDGITYYILFCFPLVMVGATGIHGDPVSVFFMDMYKWRKRKKPYFYNNNGRAYHLSAADLLIDSPSLRDILLDKLAKFRASMRAPAIEYVEGENYQFASDPELEALEAAEEERFRKTEAMTEEPKEEPKPTAAASSLNVEEIMANIKLNDLDNLDDGGEDILV